MILIRGSADNGWMMRFKRNKEQEPILGITPLIDIVFLLLIFFMLTSHFHVDSGVPITLPKITQKSYDGDIRETTVSIDKDGGIYLQGEEIDIKALGPKLKALIHQGEPSRLILQADQKVEHGRVIQVMDLAKTAGVSAIVIAAQWDPKEAY